MIGIVGLNFVMVQGDQEHADKYCELIRRSAGSYFVLDRFMYLTNRCDTLELRIWRWAGGRKEVLRCDIVELFHRPVRIREDEVSWFEKWYKECAIEVSVLEQEDCYIQVMLWHYRSNYAIFLLYDIDDGYIIGYREGIF